jgi:hypothetical protein
VWTDNLSFFLRITQYNADVHKMHATRARVEAEEGHLAPVGCGSAATPWICRVVLQAAATPTLEEILAATPTREREEMPPAE